MQHYALVLLFPVVALFACKKINTVRPPCEEQYVTIPQDTSYLSTPLVIPTQLIEDKLNSIMGQVVKQDDDFENLNKEGKKDKIKLKITRLGDVKILWKDNVARYQAPLLILVERQIVGKSVLPMSKSLALKTEFSLRLVFETTVDVGEDWKLQPQTKFVSFEWLSEVKALGGLIDVKKMVERRLHRQMPDIEKNLDETIRKSVRLDRVISRVWQKIQKPMVINRKGEYIWLKIKPIRFEMGTITTEPGNLLIQGLLAATTETLVGDDPVFTVDSTLPPLVKRKVLPNNAYLYLLSEISYEDLNEIISKKLEGKVFDVPGHRIKVKSAEIWGCGSNLVLHLKVGGDVKGEIYLQGTPQYEPDSQRIAIRNFEFEVRTEEALLASADWLLHSTFKEQMKDALSMPMAEQIVKIPEVIMKGIERGKAGKKMDFTIEQWDFKPQQIWVRSTDIATLVIVKAQVRLELEKL